MWHIRAKFDIALKAVKPPPQNVFLSCNYCGKNICPTEDEKEKETDKETKVHRTKDQNIENGSNSFKVCFLPLHLVNLILVLNFIKIVEKYFIITMHFFNLCHFGVS